MKVFITVLLAAALLAGCGPGEFPTNNPLHIPDDQIVWQGYAREDPRLENDLEAVLTCLRNIDESVVVRPPWADPYVIVTNQSVLGRAGRRENNTIYINESWLFGTSIFSHECIHWATNESNAGHGTIAFQSCETIIAFE